MILMKGRQDRQGSQGLVLGWISRNKETAAAAAVRQCSEVATTMASLPAKNLPWWPCNEQGIDTLSIYKEKLNQSKN